MGEDRTLAGSLISQLADWHTESSQLGVLQRLLSHESLDWQNRAGMIRMTHDELIPYPTHGLYNIYHVLTAVIGDCSPLCNLIILLAMSNVPLFAKLTWVFSQSIHWILRITNCICTAAFIQQIQLVRFYDRKITCTRCFVQKDMRFRNKISHWDRAPDKMDKNLKL